MNNSHAHRNPYLFWRLGLGAVISGGLVLAAAFGVAIGSTEDNGLSVVVRLLLPFIFLGATIWPKQGLYLVLLETASVDLFKKLLVIFGDTSQLDVSYMLAIPPLTVMGVGVGLLLKRVFQGRILERREWPLVLLVLAVFGMVTITALRGNQGKLGILQQIAESGSYATLVLLVPALLPTVPEVVCFLRTALFIYLPVSLYGIWQDHFGLAGFELTYMLTGLSQLVKELDDLRPRVFSTLNSNHAFSIIMAFCSALCFAQAQVRFQDRRLNRHRVFLLLSSVLFAYALVISVRRTGWLLLLLTMLAHVCFRSGRSTVGFYAGATTLVVLLFSNAQYIDENWYYWQQLLPAGSDFNEQAFRIGTFTDRVRSYQATLTNPELRSWFGLGIGGRMLAHDAIGEALASYGFAGLALIGLLCAIFLTKIHQLVLAARHRPSFRLATLLLGLLAANLVTSIIFQSHINIFPANFFFWLCAGLLVSLIMDREGELGPEPETTPDNLSFTSLATSSDKSLPEVVVPRSQSALPTTRRVTGL